MTTIRRIKKRRNQGFTLVEMIGVLAVVAILTAMLIPKVFDTINSARVSAAASAVNTVKTAVSNHYSKYGGFADSTGALLIPSADLETGADPDDLDAQNFDVNVLLPEGLLEQRFSVKMGDQLTTNLTRVRQIVTAATAAAITATSANYDMDGVDADVDTEDGALVCECVITGVSAADARALKQQIDGSDITAIANLPAIGGVATKGRVKYDAIVPGTTGTVLVYVNHR
ncbi:MAG: prepilin-type N-terminal cleavage/methylation domain-containing protein [Verrucomicrobiales bacterium]|jgi:prepilin-type N-terminal cleavage/methylation domain-containing protein